MNHTEIADIIDLAVENLERCPWGQAAGRVGAGQICAEDSIWMAAVGVKVTAPEYWEKGVGLLSDQQYRELAVKTEGATLAIRDYLGLDGDSLWRWNDELGRTKQEVIDAFKGAAKELRNKAVPA